MPGESSPITDPKQALLQSRIIWGALLLGEAVFLGIVIFLRTKGGFRTEPNDVTRLLVYVAFVLVFLMIPIGYVIRRIILRRPSGEPVQPKTYVTATIVFHALFEAAALFGLVVTLLHHRFFPAILPTLIAMFVQMRNLPDGREMQGGGSRYTPAGPS